MTTDLVDIVHKVDTLWLMVCAFLVMLMQGGFCLLESGFVRAKNSINVAIKNMVDFCVSSLAFWVVGYGLMFGASLGGWIGGSNFLLRASSDPRLLALVLFQLVFCGTSTTIVSGAVAERMRFSAYLLSSLFVSALIYPVFGHWAWGGDATTPGWLKGIGFIDFAGSTAVHSIGGWFALAAVVCMGPRIGRFDKGQTRWQGHDIPMATLGAFLLWFGWFGFNGGCTLAFNGSVPRILIATNLAAAAGGLSALFVGWARENRPPAEALINGTIAGLVSVTAGCHVLDLWAAIVVGAVAGIVMVYGTAWLEWMHIDDAVGAVPVHAFCGAWGTIAVALLGDVSLFGTGLSREKQLVVQLVGVAVAATWSFGLGMIFCKVTNRFLRLRVNPIAEIEGLNHSEHGASTELMDLLVEMQSHQEHGDFSRDIKADPYTETGQLAHEYNKVLSRVRDEIADRERAAQQIALAEQRYRSIFENSTEGIFQTTPDGHYMAANPALARIYGYDSVHDLAASVNDIARQLYVAPGRRRQFVELMEQQGRLIDFESAVFRKDRSIVWISENVRAVRDALGKVLYYEGTVIDITKRKKAEARRRKRREEHSAVKRLRAPMSSGQNAIANNSDTVDFASSN